MRRLWQNYNLGIVLFVLFLVSWLLQTYTGWVEFASEQQQHGQTAQIFGAGGYIWRWSAATMENWQSEFLQLFAMVFLTSFLVYRGSAESRDSTDRMERAIQRIEQRLQQLQAGSERTDGNGVAVSPALANEKRVARLKPEKS